MYKHFWTVLRGAAHTANDEFTDRHALAILQQQIRDSAHALAAARRAVAIAMAQNEQEREHNTRLKTRIEDLEARAMAAIQQNQTELAREAATAIANLEADAKASVEAQSRFEGELHRLKENVRKAETRLRNLQRGQRIATATEAAQRPYAMTTDDHFSSLAEAEATLLRLQNRQREIDLIAKSHAELVDGDCPERLTERLAKAGCGEPLRASADDVMARLNQRLAQEAGPANPQT